MKKLLRRIDIYGKQINLEICQNNKYITSIDIILSLITYIIIIILIGYFTINLVICKNISINTSYIIDNNQIINYSKNTILSVIGLENNKGKGYIDESVFTVNAYYSISKYNNITKEYEQTLIPLELIYCNESNYKFESEYFHNVDLSTKYCIKNNTNLLLKNNIYSYTINSIKIEFTKCDNKTSKIQCKSDKEIYSIINKLKFVGYLADNIINPDNVYMPFNKSGKTLYTTLNINILKEIYVYYSILNYINKSQFNKNDIKTCYSFEESKEDINFNNNNKFMIMYILNSNKSYQFERNYYKLYQIIAYIYSLSQIIILIGKILTYFFNNYCYKIYISHYFKNYSFDSLTDNNFNQKINMNNSKEYFINKNIKYDNTNHSFNNKSVTFAKTSEIIGNKSDKICEVISSPQKYTKHKSTNIISPLSRNTPKNKDTNIISSLSKNKNNKNNTIICNPLINNFTNTTKKSSNKLNKNINNKYLLPNDNKFNLYTEIIIIFKLITCNKIEYKRKNHINKIYNNIKIYLDIMRLFKLYNDTEFLKNNLLTYTELYKIDNIHEFCLNKANIINILNYNN